MVDEPEMKDSGERRTFASGAKRDRGGFKPRPDLVSPHANLRAGAWLAKGAEKYGPRNYEKGMPISECIASLNRHLEDYKLGLTNEDHLAAIIVNAQFITHFEEEIKAGRMDPAIDDMPKYTQQRMLTPAACSDEANMHRRKELLERMDAVADELSDDQPLDLEPLQKHLADLPSATEALTGQSSAVSIELDTIPEGQRVVHVPQEDKPVPTFYVAGPMRGYRFFNFPAFDRARDRGLRMGFKIISPADLDRANGIDPQKWPTEIIAWYDENGWMDLHPKHKRGPNWLREIVTRDTEVIIALEPERGDGLALLPYWGKSTGACTEKFLAKWLQLQILDARNFRPLIEATE